MKLLIDANLPSITDALREGAIASLSRDRLRVRGLPISDKPAID